MKKILYIAAAVVLCFFDIGCKEFLEVKPDKRMAVPSTLEDLEAILNNTTLMNGVNLGLGEASADNFFVTTDTWNALPESERETYIWGENIIPISATGNNTWQDSYQAIYYANTVMEFLRNDNDYDQNKVNAIKGKALFFRAFYYLALTATWAPVFDEIDADQPLGVPLRLSPDFNTVSKRATVRECYAQVKRDISEALPLLPAVVEQPMDPNKPAAYALLSRMYLAMRDYDRSRIYADSCLAMGSELLDYNKIVPLNRYSIPRFNQEVLFNTSGSVTLLLYGMAYGIDSTFYDSYAQDDLRKKLFFTRNNDGSIRYVGSYYGSSSAFTGLAIDEVYLNKAECLARQGEGKAAIEILNDLLRNRVSSDSFAPITEAKNALQMILTERRKELIFRDLRWMDLKRLNKEPEYETSIKREIDGQVYELKPNDARYLLPLPENVKQFLF